MWIYGKWHVVVHCNSGKSGNVRLKICGTSVVVITVTSNLPFVDTTMMSKGQWREQPLDIIVAAIADREDRC